MNCLNSDEKDIAAALAKHIEIDIRFDRSLCKAPVHVSSAALTAKILLVAADAYHGDEKSFVAMAHEAIRIIRGIDAL